MTNSRIARLITIIALFAGIIATTNSPSFAEDMLLKAEVQEVSVATDKNGKEYVRIIVAEDKELNGIKYTVGVPVMCFGATVGQAKQVTPGETLTCIADKGEYRGNTSYTLRAVIKQ